MSGQFTVDIKFCLYFLIAFLFTNIHGTKTDQSCQGILPKMPLDITKETIDHTKLAQQDLSSCEAYDQLIEVLEKLSILTARTTSCYSLKNVIRKSSVGRDDQNQRNVLITLQFVENFVHSFDNVNSSGSLQDTDYSVTKTSCQNSGSSISSVKEPMSMHQSTNESETNYNVSSILPTKQTDDADGEDSGGLSHTQVVVIATCSSVIGTFFIVAAVMRIRNYIKRWREEQMSARRTNYRLPLQSSSHNTPKQSRQGSLNSKASPQNSPGTKRDNLYLQVSNGLSTAQNPASKVTYLDTNPMLVITAPSTVPNTPSDSHASIQFIDEDVTDKGSSVPTTPEEENEAEKKPLIEKKQQYSDNNTEIKNVLVDENNLDASPSLCDSSNLQLEETPDRIDDHSIDSPAESQSASGVSPTEDESTGNICSINSGITQSDESLNSETNPSYCYGNQAEYSWNSGYGNVAYCPNEINMDAEYDNLENNVLESDLNEECMNGYHSNDSNVHIQNTDECAPEAQAQIPEMEKDIASSLDNDCNDISCEDVQTSGTKPVKNKTDNDLYGNDDDELSPLVSPTTDLISNCPNTIVQSPAV